VLTADSILKKAALVPVPSLALSKREPAHSLLVPVVIADAGGRASQRFVEFFTANIRNKNTRAAYGRAVAALPQFHRATSPALACRRAGWRPWPLLHL
jgi:hypothetical protein